MTVKLLGGAELVKEAFRLSATRLQLEMIDQLLIHWPNPQQDRYVDAWRGLVSLRADGLVRSIGVSNFKEHHLKRLIDETGVAPDVNQVELNPFVSRQALRAFHAEHGVVTEAWAPLGKGGRATGRPRHYGHSGTSHPVSGAGGVALAHAARQHRHP